MAFGTSHVALAVRAGVKPGQTVLVLGAAGGVGTAAVQVHLLTHAVNMQTKAQGRVSQWQTMG